jgi:hypothetical protein
MNTERVGRSLPGIPMFLLLLALSIALGVAVVGWIVQVMVPTVEESPLVAVTGFVLLLLAFGLSIALFAGLTPVNPNEARALVLFGHYNGTIRSQGLQWVNPLTERRKISLRVRNFETSRLKVNDFDGNPVEIAAVVVWKVTDTAEALFEVDDYENFVHVQAESALRNLATSHPYDSHDSGELALRSNPVEIASALRTEIQDRLVTAGVEVIEARISHLAYAQEIANAMLRRQQANAVIAARSRIVEGAVSMVEMALDELSKRKVVELDPERRAAMVSNLLVVLCGERGTQPIVNAGSIY